MKRVLIITYYWPPSGGGGVQRWLKFVKYLPSNGWKPVVAVPENPEYPVIDLSLQNDIPKEAEIIKLPIWEPYGIFKKITGRKKEERVNTGLLFDEKKQTSIEKISLAIRGNFLIPDPRIFWVKPSIKRLKKLIPGLNVEAIITTGPPHSVHLIGYRLNKIFGIPWIADLRDPWSNLDLLDKFYASKLARFNQKRIEKRVLTSASNIISVSPSWARELEKIIQRPVEVIFNGFDKEDLVESNQKNNDLFVISHIGLINSFRNQCTFWQALNELCLESDEFKKKLKISIVGIFDKQLSETLKQYSGLEGKLEFSGYIAHSEVNQKYAGSDCLLLLQNRTNNTKGHIPGKVFEYLASEKPIVALADPDSDISNIIDDCKAGFVCSFEDKKAIKKAIMTIFNGQYEPSDKKKVETFERNNLTKKLSKVILKTTNNIDNQVSNKDISGLKKVLIITYYWPPSGGGGVMRWLKMSKYLPDLGWQPIIYTPLNPDSSVSDNSLIAEIHPEIEEIKTPIWEPYDVYRKITGKKESSKFKAGYVSEASSGNWKNKLSVFIRGNFLIPDPRKFWIKPSVKFLSKYLKENPVDLIISTGPPHSMHLIALGLKKKFDIQWIADFRDPWTDIDFYTKLRLTKWADKKHRKLEKKVLRSADNIVTVSPSWQQNFLKMSNREIDLVNNGFDPEDFSFGKIDIDDHFTISHFGVLNKDRNPVSLWKVISELSQENKEFKQSVKIQLIGQTDESVINEIEKNGLSNQLQLIDYMPHKEGLNVLHRSQLLLLPINDSPNVKGILPGKMYEYLALKRPILAIGPTNADYADIIHETQSGVCHNFNDEEGIKLSLINYFNQFKQNQLKINSSSIEKYSRKNLAKKFMDLAIKINES